MLPNAHVLDQFANAGNPEPPILTEGHEGHGRQSRIFVASSGTRASVFGVNPSRHKIQGVGPGVVPKNLDTSLTDEVITVTAEDAMGNAKRLARQKGLLVASREENKEKMIVTVFPSGGDIYMNSDLFAAGRQECIAMIF
ncbi:hypothetical protein BS78_04G260700 [Paspalum vaginatum]|nr:hypothetical protein BS78_04G260700 [Paspalum vaginatum]